VPASASRGPRGARVRRGPRTSASRARFGHADRNRNQGGAWTFGNGNASLGRWGHARGQPPVLGAIVALVVAVIAGVLGFGGIAGAAADIARILFWVFLVIFLVSW
jgi:uncharacterized membrane protein YtjA (UPF0391 family)